MRNALRVTLVATLALVAVPAMAGKIGFVKVERAVATVQEGKAKLKELEEWAKPRTQELQQLSNRVGELQRQVEQQSTVATPEALGRLQAEGRETQRRLEDADRQYRRDLDAKQNEVLRDVARKLNQVVTDYAKSNDYDAVFLMKEETLVYLAPTADLTDIVIRLYDQRFPLQQ